MNTELDSPLVVWGGSIMLVVGIFGWAMIPLFFGLGINLFSNYIRGDGVLGFGAILGAVFGGIGGAFVIKTHEYKKIKKQRQQSPCKSVRKTGKHDWQEMRDQIKYTTYELELPAKCKDCGKETVMQFSASGEKK